MNRVAGLLLLAKPRGLTSFRVLDAVKRRLETRKVGHAGTLDRFASGLLVVLVGPYSRLTNLIQAGEKTYRGIIRFGAETDTLDPEGSVVAEAAPPSREALEAALPRFRGMIEQKPPAYSAIHLGGKRAYERALAGESVDPPARPVDIRELTLERFDGREATVLVRCSAGTYIRSLARDIGLAASSRAYLVELERLAIGPFGVAEAVAPDDIDPERDLRPFSPAYAEGLGIAILRLPGKEATRFRNGAELDDMAFSGSNPARAEGIRAVFDIEDRFLGAVEEKSGRLVYRFVLGETP